MSHVLVIYTDDEPGVLTRVAMLFRRRGFNIHSPVSYTHLTLPTKRIV